MNTQGGREPALATCMCLTVLLSHIIVGRQAQVKGFVGGRQECNIEHPNQGPSLEPGAATEGTMRFGASQRLSLPPPTL